MANKILTAEVTEVRIGHLTIDGLMAEDGNFFVGFPQANDLFRFSDTQNYASQTLKRILGKDFQSHKLKTPLNPKAINAISLSDFELLVAKLDRAGNKSAQEFRDSLVGMALNQLFCDAFGVKFDEEDRQEFLKSRQESKILFWQLTEQIKAYTESRVCHAPVHTYYTNAFDALNVSLFGKKAKQIREDLGIEVGHLNRDHFGHTSIRHICTVQSSAAKKMQRDPSLKPIDAVKMVVSFLEIEPMDFRS